MLFFSFFKTFIGKTVTVELKNDVIIRGKVHSVDQYLNIKLEDIEILNVETCPQLVGFFLGLLFEGNGKFFIDDFEEFFYQRQCN
ncbi:U6 snRNA-associated Sm-like protein LSm2 [Galdieria sulphuraria]|uniref:U6 snRNA-associated Sm-like protein LSm2 n=1 Tax=Galdieria sulphuraria TaxID=130081 RepID=M2VZZ1_GALSU|nr:U6 snRNA-associated Sm-like protein LSm2 [Galdieria sulphuraria]EME28921.1 U6 snRNA-associated Sm-like protein LSm2 [Galdieria sulphuraria]|eukprot:XP_005705441.1 U6 snRNA-associated Sm-like protein LSm2 [Galdieria sulphuraria]